VQTPKIQLIDLLPVVAPICELDLTLLRKTNSSLASTLGSGHRQEAALHADAHLTDDELGEETWK